MERWAHDQDHLLPENQNQGWMVRQPPSSTLSKGRVDTSWYFNTAASYYMLYNLKEHEDPTHLQFASYLRIIFLSGVQYCKSLDTELILLGVLDCKNLTYFASKSYLTIKDGKTAIMIG